VMMECIFDTCLCGVLYWMVGFAFEFGVGNSIIGHSFFFLHHNGADYNGTGIAFYAFVLFQFAFADTASTITSGAMVGRTSFKGDILYSLGVSGFIYPLTTHWIWGPGGWLNSGTMGWFNGIVPDGIIFRDFAGSTAVHTVGGMLALAGAIALGGFVVVQAQAGPGGHGHAFGLEGITKQLNLTSDQQTKVQPILDAAKPQLAAIHQEAMQKAKGVMDSTLSQIRPLLTLEQQKKLDAVQKAHQDMMNAHKELQDAMQE